MSGFLLDTNIISSLAPSRTAASAQFLEWLERTDAEGRVFLSVVTIHEIERGIALLEHKGATAKAASLRACMNGLVSVFEDKILSLDSSAASFSGQLEAKALSAGHDPGMADAAIAGIAQAHDLAIVTENTKRFLPFGARVMTPEDVSR